MYTICTLLCLVTCKANPVHNVTYYFFSLRDFRNFSRSANLCCMDHATICMSIKGWVDWHAPSYFCTKPKIPYQYCPGCRFKEDLQKALKDSLSLVSLVGLKAEHRHTLYIIQKISARRDVFGQLLAGYGKSLACCILPGVLNSFNANKSL